MKTTSREHGLFPSHDLITPALVEYNKTPRERLLDLDALTLVGERPIRRVFLYTDIFPASNYTHIHPCAGEGRIIGLQFHKGEYNARQHRVDFTLDMTERDIMFIVHSPIILARWLGEVAKAYIVHLDPLRPEVERDYTYYKVTGGNSGERP